MAGKIEKISNSDSDSESGRISPDSQCCICLGRLQSKSFSDSCLHNFCFQCLVKWSEIKAECPLCKQPFTSIIHNVRSSLDYDQYMVPIPEPSREPTLLLSDIMPYHLIMQVYSNVIMPPSTRSSRPYARMMPHLPRSRFTNGRGRQRNRRCRALSFRSSIYRQHQWVMELTNGGIPRRESNPHFYRSNPCQLERLSPWIARELEALDCTLDHRSLTQRILGALTRISISSREFRDMLLPDIGDRVDHFIHELEAFATSNYDMAGFDENAEYWPSTSPIRSLRRPRLLYDSSSAPAPNPLYPRTTSTVPPPTTLDDSDVEVVQVVNQPNSDTVVVLDSDTDLDLAVIEPEPRPQPEEIFLLSSDDEPTPSTSHQASLKNVASSSSYGVPETSGTTYRNSYYDSDRISSSPSDSDSDYQPVARKSKSKRPYRYVSDSDSDESQSHKKYKRRLKSSRSGKRTTTITIVEESMSSSSKKLKKKSERDKRDESRKKRHKSHSYNERSRVSKKTKSSSQSGSTMSISLEFGMKSSPRNDEPSSSRWRSPDPETPYANLAAEHFSNDNTSERTSAESCTKLPKHEDNREKQFPAYRQEIDNSSEDDNTLIELSKPSTSRLKSLVVVPERRAT